MSLWTPSGEHPIPDDRDKQPRPQPAPDAEAAPDSDPMADLSDEDRERAKAMAAEMAEVRRQVQQAPASTVISNHAMGFYELAAIYLTATPAKLEDAKLAIDAMGALVENLTGRLGEHEATLQDALAQLRLAFVQVQAGGVAEAAPPE